MESNFKVQENSEIDIEEIGEKILTPFKPEDIKISNPPMNMGDLIDLIKEGWINLNTEYQREGNLWGGNKPSRLIESILLGLRLPAFYFEEVSKKEYKVIDGLQRCCVVKDFCVDNKFELRNLEFLGNFEGKKYEDFNFEIRRDIRRLPITVNILERGSPDQVKFILFQRLNSGGLELTKQEIRNAIFQGDVVNLIKSMRPNFDFATEGVVSNKRKEADDFICRFITFYISSYEDYEPDLDSYIMKSLSLLRDEWSTNDRDKMFSDFKKAMEISYNIFGNDAFRKRFNKEDKRGRINKAYFEVLSNIFARLNNREKDLLLTKKDVLKNELIELMNDSSFERSLSAGTGNKDNVVRRFSSIKEVVSKIIT